MERYEPAWIFNFVLKIALAIFLGTLAIGLAVGVTPFTALMRSGAGFGVFTMLAWAAALAWEMPKKEEPATADVDAPQAEAEQAQPGPATNGTNGSQRTSSPEQFAPFSAPSIDNVGGTTQPQAVAANSPVQQLEAVP